MSSAVITGPGVFAYQLLTLSQARAWLDRGPYESTVGYDATAEAMDILLGVRPAVQRGRALLRRGDEALIFRLTVRVTDERLKSHLTRDYVMKHCEVGLITRLR